MAQRGLAPDPNAADDPNADPASQDQSQTDQNAAPDAAGADQQGADDAQDPEPNVSPDEQKQFDELVDNGQSLLYDTKTRAALEAHLKADANRPDGSPPEGLASAVVTVVVRLVEDAKSKNVTLSPDVIFHGGMALIEDLADYAQKKGIVEYDDKEIEQAAYRAMDLYRQQTGGMDAQSAANDMKGLAAADQSGQLEQQVPGLGEKFGAAGGDGQDQPADGEQPPAQEQA